MRFPNENLAGIKRITIANTQLYWKSNRRFHKNINVGGCLETKSIVYQYF